jgi:nucleoside triphosphatase
MYNLGKQLYPEPTVGAVIFNPQQEILLIKGKKFKDTYVIPGGHIEVGETLEETLRREVKEETGLDIDEFHLLSFQESIFNPHYHEKRHFLYIDFVCTTSSTQVVLNEESQEYRWVALPDAFDLPLHPYTRALLTEYMKGASSAYRKTILVNYKQP